MANKLKKKKPEVKRSAIAGNEANEPIVTNDQPAAEAMQVRLPRKMYSTRKLPKFFAMPMPAGI